MTAEGLQILTYAWHLWPLISDGSLVTRGICLLWSSPRTRDTPNAERFAVELSLPVLTT